MKKILLAGLFLSLLALYLFNGHLRSQKNRLPILELEKRGTTVMSFIFGPKASPANVVEYIGPATFWTGESQFKNPSKKSKAKTGLANHPVYLKTNRCQVYGNTIAKSQAMLVNSVSYEINSVIITDYGNLNIGMISSKNIPNVLYVECVGFNSKSTVEDLAKALDHKFIFI